MPSQVYMPRQCVGLYPMSVRRFFYYARLARMACACAAPQRRSVISNSSRRYARANMHMSLHMSIRMSLHVSVRMSVRCLSRESIRMPMFMSTHMSTHLSSYLCIRTSTYDTHVCMHVYTHDFDMSPCMTCLHMSTHIPIHVGLIGQPLAI